MITASRSAAAARQLPLSRARTLGFGMKQNVASKNECEDSSTIHPMSAVPVNPVKSRKHFEQRCASITQEYLILGNEEDAFESFVICWRKQWLQYFTKAALHVVLDHDISSIDSFVSLLMYIHVRGALPHPSIESGVELVLKKLPDLIKDVPQAIKYLGAIIGHLIANNLIPETFLDAVPALAGEDLGSRVVAEVRSAVALPLPITTYKKLVDAALLELFASGDVEEACLRIKEAGPKHLGAEAVKRSVIAGVERKGKDRELVSRLLMRLVSSNTIGRDGVMEGFLRVTRRLTDLSLDNPGAAEVVGRFLARAICDESVPPVAEQTIAQQSVCFSEEKLQLAVGADAADDSEGIDKDEWQALCGLAVVSNTTRILLVQPGGRARLSHIWSSALDDIAELQSAVRSAIDDYLSHGDVSEGVKSIRELDAPSFSHEIINQMFLHAIGSGELKENRCIALLAELVTIDYLSPSTLVKGVLSYDVQLTRDKNEISPSAVSSLLRIVGGLARVAAVPKSLLATLDHESDCFDESHRIATVHGVIQDYLASKDTTDVVSAVKALDLSIEPSFFLYHSVSFMLDLSASSHEDVLLLVASLVLRGVFEIFHLEVASEMLLKDLEDLSIDVPLASKTIAHFFVNCVEGGLLPEAFIDSIEGLAGSKYGSRVVAEVRSAVALPLPITTYKKLVDAALLELFASGDVEEACLRIKEAGPKHLGAEAVKRSVIAGVERKGKDRELVSRLLMRLVSSNTIGRDGVMEGFLRVTRRLTDLSLDNPGAAEVVGRFLARAICDEVVAQSMLRVCSDSGPNGKSISDQARFFLVQPGGRSRVQLLWGVVGDIEQLTEALFGVAEEFIHHRNVDEAIVSFRELDGPGVGHEIVRQVILVSLNHGVEGEELCAKLLDTMFSSNTISRFSMVRGILRCAEVVGTVGWKADSLMRIATRFTVPLISTSVTSPASPVCSPQPSP